MLSKGGDDLIRERIMQELVYQSRKGDNFREKSIGIDRLREMVGKPDEEDFMNVLTGLLEDGFVFEPVAGKVAKI